MQAFDPNRITFFAKTDARGANVPFGIKAIDRTKHMYVIGKTGMGKSTLLENMAVQDIRNGEGLAFIDPHGATAETLLDYIPEERKEDVLYFAPFDMEHPISFNVMEDVGVDKRHLVVSGLMSVFEKIWVDAWSARMAYILQNTLMALLEYPDSTLLGVNRVLSDKNYRKKVVDNISDPSVRAFWVDEFAKYNERYMQEAGDAIKNKIGQFTANPLIRNVIGQPKSSFSIREIMDNQKILIMNLSKGLVGESNANLLGSMLTTRIYLAAMSRADMPQAQLREMPNFYFYVDEFQSFANATFANILSEARKYKLNLTIAHQYIEQMEEEVRNAVFGNVGTICSFRVGPFDAEILETIFAPQFQAIDIVNLGFAQIYLTLMIDGVGSQPFSATTLPPLQLPSVSCREIILHNSRQQFAKPRAVVEKDIIKWHENQHESETKSGGERPKPDSNRSSGGGQTNSRNGTGQRFERPKERGDRPRSERDDRPRPERDPSPERTERPKDRREDRREDKQEDSRPKPAANGATKNLDDLRSVLAQISQQQQDKPSPKPESKPEPKREFRESKPNSGAKPPPSKPAPPEQEKPKPDQPKGETPKTVDLKQALSAALERRSGEQPPATDPKLPPQPPAQPTPAAPPQEPPKTTQQPASQQNPPPQERPTSEPISPPRQSTPDPLDPKTLERMLRVSSSDRSPLK